MLADLVFGGASFSKILKYLDNLNDEQAVSEFIELGNQAIEGLKTNTIDEDKGLNIMDMFDGQPEDKMSVIKRLAIFYK